MHDARGRFREGVRTVTAPFDFCNSFAGNPMHIDAIAPSSHRLCAHLRRIGGMIAVEYY
ncbi:MAG: hypothetical protein ACTHOH_13325 [Lysobacteraceae bacterium]